MAYSDDISGLNADHHWKFNGNSTDTLGSVVATNTGVIFTDGAIAKDATNCMTVNGLTDRVSLATTTTINNSVMSRKVVGGWYTTTGYQAPPSRIYGEGTNTTCFQFSMGFGNNLIFECTEPANFATGLQIFGPSLIPDRIYHIVGVFYGNTNGNEIKLFVDGIEIFNADPLDRQPDTGSLDSRGVGEFGDPAGTTGLGGGSVLQQAARNGKYQHWFAIGDNVNAELTDTEIRETLFERGTLADFTVSSGTESAMQTALDAITDTQGNSPCCIEIEPVSGGGDFALTSEKTFDELASIHFRYNGTADTLTITNITGGDASIGSAPFGGTLILATRQTLTVTVKDLVTGANVEGARVYIEADTGGDLTAGTVIMSTNTNASGVATVSHDYTSNQPIKGYVRKGTSITRYKESAIGGPLTSIPLNTTILMVADE